MYIHVILRHTHRMISVYRFRNEFSNDETVATQKYRTISAIYTCIKSYDISYLHNKYLDMNEAMNHVILQHDQQMVMIVLYGVQTTWPYLNSDCIFVKGVVTT